ncbi:DUF2187 family protein [Halalkalibacterium ligniniphilum]|uniref:DUF2187 family protein n=1 Tax=Halalkalibacterium ligniniphilum TaxID=1134413 RepID=UPI00034AAE38|nr:DUF2187 family protein [Halalkalibacterium ligniniphilum]
MAQEEKDHLEQLNIAQIKEVIIHKGYEMKVLAVHTNSVVAEFLDYPIKGEEDAFPYSRTVINHKRYERTFKTIDGEVVSLDD